MLPSKSFSSLKGMLPKINQPLPLNEKTTKKLLDTLTTSFRKNLDREHGWVDDETDLVSKQWSSKSSKLPPSSMEAAASVPTKPGPAHKPPPRPTDRHLRSILTNPLFSYDQTLGNQTSHGTERDPMDTFDWAVARGLMTTKRAAGCLLAKRREAVLSSHVSPQVSMNASGAGIKVVQWLRASGLERDLAFLTDTQLTGILVQYLAAEEGLDEIVWDWIERLKRGEGPQVIPSVATGRNNRSSRVNHNVSSASYVLDKLVKAKTTGADTLDEAYRAMARGARLFDKTTPAFEGNVFWPWCYLSWISTFKAWSLSNPSPQLYESFVSIMEHDNRSSILLERAHLDLRHPTHPTPGPAVALLADDHLLRDVQASTPAVEPPPGRRPGYPGRIVSMGLDTVRHLAFIGESDEAQRILDRLRQQFGSHLTQPLHT